MKEKNFLKLDKNCYWDPHREAVYVDGLLVPLSENKTKCLKLLIYCRGKPLKDIEIFDFVWKYKPLEFNNKAVRSLISNLRNALPCLNIINHYGGFYSLEKYREPTPDFQEYLLDFMDQAKNGIVITDPNQKDNPIIYVNEAFTNMFGYTAEQVIGKNCGFLQGENTEQSAIAQMREAIKKQTEVLAVVKNYHKNGELIYNEVQISPIFDKHTLQIKYFLGVQKDVTELYTLMMRLKI